MSRIAAIDLGTNTVRIMVAERSGESFEQIFSDQVITRLGEGSHENGKLAPEAMKRTAEGVAGLVRNADSFRPFKLFITATSAARDASNTGALDAMIHSATGVKLRIIPWEEEARLSLLGAKMVVGDDIGRFILFDIGGGSTEYILSAGEGKPQAAGTNLGVVRLAETYITKHPVVDNEYNDMMKEINAKVDRAFTDIRAKGDETLVGTAGTVTSLAAIALRLVDYSPAKVNGYRLTKKIVEELRRKLFAMTLEERGRISHISGGREDLIVPGIGVILATMKRFGADSLIVSDYGIREGLILDILATEANG